jgi:hypothetical protein
MSCCIESPIQSGRLVIYSRKPPGHLHPESLSRRARDFESGPPSPRERRGWGMRATVWTSQNPAACRPLAGWAAWSLGPGQTRTPTPQENGHSYASGNGNFPGAQLTNYVKIMQNDSKIIFAQSAAAALSPDGSGSVEKAAEVCT